MFSAYLGERLTDFGLSYTAKQLEQFTAYYEMVVATNQVLNLTAITEEKEFAVKHIVDSLSSYRAELFKPTAKLLDLGTGAGFPGIPLAIYRPDLEIVLFDSLKKRLTFLEKVIHTLGLGKVTVLHGRAEDCAHDIAHREAYDLVTSRAVARLPVLLEWALPYVKQGGYFISLKGAAYEVELEASRKALSVLGGLVEEVRPVTLPTLDDKRAIIYVKKEKNTGKTYPRRPKEIKDKPLG